MSSDQPPTDPFAPDVVAAILRHMNREHLEDSLVICRAYGPTPDATSAELVTIEPSGMGFSIETAGGTETLVLPWTDPVRERGDIRAEIVGRYHAAREVLGLGSAEQHE